MSEPIKTKIDGSILEVTIDRPKANAIDANTSKILGDVFADFRDNFLAHIPNDFPNFDLEIIYVVAEGDRVHVFVKYTADNLDAHGVHMFLVEDGLQKEFTIFDDSQKIAVAHAG